MMPGAPERQDRLGQSIRPLDVVCYPVRRGSWMEMRDAVVLKVAADRLHFMLPNRRQVIVLSTARVTKVPGCTYLDLGLSWDQIKDAVSQDVRARQECLDSRHDCNALWPPPGVPDPETKPWWRRLIRRATDRGSVPSPAS